VTTIAPIRYDYANLFGNARPPATPGHGFGAVFSTPESCLAESNYRDITNRGARRLGRPQTPRPLTRPTSRVSNPRLAAAGENWC
jgi:hypothetical protein